MRPARCGRGPTTRPDPAPGEPAAATGHRAQARRSLRGGALSSFGTSAQMTLDNGTQPDQLVEGKRVHHLLPPAEAGWRRSGIRGRLGPVHQVRPVRGIAILVQPVIWPLPVPRDRKSGPADAGPVPVPWTPFWTPLVDGRIAGLKLQRELSSTPLVLIKTLLGVLPAPGRSSRATP